MWSTVWNSGLSTPFFAAHHPIWSMMKGTRSFRRRLVILGKVSAAGGILDAPAYFGAAISQNFEALQPGTSPPTMLRMRMPRTPASSGNSATSLSEISGSITATPRSLWVPILAQRLQQEPVGASCTGKLHNEPISHVDFLSSMATKSAGDAGGGFQATAG